MKQNRGQIPRLDAVRVDFLRDVVTRGEPLVIGPAERGWRKLPRWTTELLAARLGARRVIVASSATEVFNYSANRARYRHIEMSFDALVKRLKRPASGRQPPGRRPQTRASSKQRLYLMQQPLDRWFPELNAEVRLPGWLAKRPVLRHLWLGARGNRTPLHYDTAHNLFAQIHGRKRFMLFMPSEGEWLHPHPEQSRAAHVSRIDPERPGPHGIPELFARRSRELILEPGEHLFLPAGCWHHVRSLDITISVNAWWTPR